MTQGPTAETTDAAIIDASRSDPAAFETIFQRHYDALFRFLAIRTDRDLAAEIASETFLVAFEHRSDFAPSYTSARPWIFGIANNLLRNSLRRRSAQKRQAKPLSPTPAGFEDDVAWRVDA